MTSDTDTLNVQRGRYDYHPVVSLLTLLQDMNAVLEAAPPMQVNLIRAAEYKKRAEAARPQIEAWQKEGLRIREIKSRLGISQETLYKYIKFYKVDAKEIRS